MSRVLVANAGVATRRVVDDVDEAFFDEIVGTDLVIDGGASSITSEK